ncbi:pentapeptide repeat-containing protein [Amycolatopsis magusensis]|uniref:pentapeptide repeat-containing protein n=1 Tax=Amycolatopsis magusensis TaxID=882444 RepID=UPI0037B56566
MNDDRSKVESGVLSNRVIAWSAAGLLLVAVGVSWPLLAVYGLGLEAIRAVGTIVLGAGGAIGLLLAARRQQTAEQDLVEKRRDLAHKEHIQQHNEDDASERRITELYAKAVEQLGSDKAPVRLGGLYALERLAQNTSSQRHTVVNVLCAYLRMPFAPGDDQAADALPQERQVRIAAQRILALHLRPGEGFWPDVVLDLSGATLVDFRLKHCQVRSADFTGATFDGDADLGATTFRSRGEFDRTTFTGNARFSEAAFAEGARFRHAQFLRPVRFRGTRFQGDARFTAAHFADSVWLGQAVFRGDALFTQVRFEQDVRFDNAIFARDAKFHDATFTREPRRQPKMLKGVWTQPATRSHWPPGWAPADTPGEPWPDSGNRWQKLVRANDETADADERPSR